MTEYFLLTGLPRTGTTWAYQALAAGSGSEKVYEPFNYKWHPERSPFHMRYLAPGTHHLDFLSALGDEIAKVNGSQIFIKEVHACLAVAYIWEHLRPHTIVLLRHPCAMAASWRRLDFKAGPRLDVLLDQKEVVEIFLAPHLDHIRSSADPFFQIGAFWGAAYHCLHQISSRHPEWQWVTHERLCAEMEPAFIDLLSHFGYEWQAAGSRYLHEHDRQPGEYHPHRQVRLSEKEPEKWREELTADQSSAVLAGAGGFGVLERYYS